MVSKKQIRERIGDDLTDQEVSQLQKILEGVENMSEEEFSKEEYEATRGVIEGIIEEIKTERMHTERARLGLKAILSFIELYKEEIINPWEKDYLTKLKGMYDDCKKYVMERFGLSEEKAVLSEEEWEEKNKR